MKNFIWLLIKGILTIFLGVGSIIAISIPIFMLIAEMNNLQYETVFVCEYLPVLVIEDKNLFIPKKYMKSDAAAMSVGSIIVLSQGAWKDESILAHELEHARQRYRGLFIINALRLRLSPQYRIITEYEAYNKEKYPPTKEELVELLSSELYNFRINKEEIQKIVSEI